MLEERKKTLSLRFARNQATHRARRYPPPRHVHSFPWISTGTKLQLGDRKGRPSSFRFTPDDGVCRERTGISKVWVQLGVEDGPSNKKFLICNSNLSKQKGFSHRMEALFARWGSL